MHGGEHVEKRHDRIRYNTIRAWDGGSTRDRDTSKEEARGGPTTPIREASAVTKQRKSDGTVGGGGNSGTGVDTRSGKAGEQARDDTPKSGRATAMEDRETDAEVGKATYHYEWVREG
jgi:hypothetical protein